MRRWNLHWFDVDPCAADYDRQWFPHGQLPPQPPGTCLVDPRPAINRPRIPHRPTPVVPAPVNPGRPVGTAVMVGSRIRVKGRVIRRPIGVEAEVALAIERTDAAAVIGPSMVRCVHAVAQVSRKPGRPSCNNTVLVQPYAPRYITVATHLVLARQVDSPCRRPVGDVLESIAAASMPGRQRRAATTVAPSFALAGRPVLPDGDFRTASVSLGADPFVRWAVARCKTNAACPTNVLRSITVSQRSFQFPTEDSLTRNVFGPTASAVRGWATDDSFSNVRRLKPTWRRYAASRRAWAFDDGFAV